MTSDEHENLWRRTVVERAERMENLNPIERSILINAAGDKVIDRRDEFRRRRFSRKSGT